MKYYCIGIKGSGMATLACLLKDLGNEVSGYDDAKDFNGYFEEYRPSFFVITKQKDNFEKLVPEDILGIAETSTTFGAIKNLDYLQTNPNFLNKVQPAFKHIGMAMLKFIEGIYKGQRLEIISVSKAENFYLKNGYQRLNNDEHVFFKYA